MRLFRERATAARPGVRLDDERVEALVERLDGLPLAIELAAARVRAMSVEEIGRRLDDRFALLRGGSREAPERHQTLLAVIDWSWNLLDPEEQFALRRIAVFRDGFSLEGVAAVVGSADDPVDVVTRLVDQSLVVVHETDGELALPAARDRAGVRPAPAGSGRRRAGGGAAPPGLGGRVRRRRQRPALHRGAGRDDGPDPGRGGQPARRPHPRPGRPRRPGRDPGDGGALEHVDGRGQPPQGGHGRLGRRGRDRGRRRPARARGRPALRARDAHPEHPDLLRDARGAGGRPAARSWVRTAPTRGSGR